MQQCNLSFESYLQNQSDVILDTYQKGMHVVQVKRMQNLGKLAALKFLSWLLENPSGVISFPTGKTPQAFISALQYYKEYWKTQAVQQELQAYGIYAQTFPETRSLKFVQMDEFFLMHPGQKNSFSSYIKRNYLSLLEIDPDNALLMDFSEMGFELTEKVRQIFAVSVHELTCEKDKMLRASIMKKAQYFCKQYEEKIAQWGGIGFFLGGIGPDGHIAFNVAGSSFMSTTRLLPLNYPSAAAAAVSLGGIEYARGKLVMTIGLQTIVANPQVHIVCMAAGEAKAGVIAQAITGSISEQSPGSIFQNHDAVTWLLTHGAASKLPVVRRKKWARAVAHIPDMKVIEELLTAQALKSNKQLNQLQQKDFLSHPDLQVIQSLLPDLQEHGKKVAVTLEKKLEHGNRTYKYQSIVHTAPHHDDVMLSYYSYALRLLEANKNVFLYATSGFNSVTNQYMQGLLRGVDQAFIDQYTFCIFKKSYQVLLEEFAQAYKDEDKAQQRIIERIIVARKVVDIFNIKTPRELEEITHWLWFGYFNHVYPGKKDIEAVQILKGAMRESEVDRMWALSDVFSSQVVHLRSRFYTGDYFTPQPTIQGDAQPLLTYLAAYQPTILTVALDPEGTGPDTHYKVLQIVGKALSMYHDQTGSQLRVWGYRNVWHKFQVHESTKIILVTEQEIAAMEQVFLSCFSTQKKASFPALHYDGPFSGLMRELLTDQYGQLQTLLGSSHALLQGYAGAIFLKDMSLDEFLQAVYDLSLKNDLD